MSKIINLIKRPSLVYPLLVIVLSLMACWSLFKPGYFSMHDDVQVMRLYEMEKCFNDGQFPCRWVPDMGAGYGHPLYNFHPVFSYYLGMFFRMFGFSFILSIKSLFLLTYVLSGVFTYFLLKEFFGKWPAIAGAIVFVFAPYHSVEVFVRGAMTESWGVVFFPAIFFCLYKFIKEERLKWFVLAIFSLVGLFLSHNIMTFIFTPIAIVWSIFWSYMEKKLKYFWKTCLIFVWAFALSSFFLLPAFFEKNLVKIETLTSDYYDFHHHFTTLKQLFLDRSFGYGPSRPGPIDDMSFQLGFPQWPLAMIAGIAGLVLFLRKREKTKYLLIIFIFVLWFFSVFMTHGKSVFIWNRLPLISFVQFPWRFLALAMFFGGFLTGGLCSLLKKYQAYFAIFIIILSVSLNLGYFHPEKNTSDATDQIILSGKSREIQSMATLMDYMPKQVKEFPKSLAPVSPWLIKGEAKITEYQKRSDFWRFTFESIDNDSVIVRVPVFDFPKWVVLIDQQPVVFDHDNALGLIQLSIPPGKHTIVGWFKNTPLRSLANFVTMFSFFGLMALIVIKKDEKFG